MLDAPVAPISSPIEAPSFTSEPIVVNEPVQAELSGNPGELPPPVVTTPEPLVTALAKANSEARANKKQAEALNTTIAELKAQLAAAQEVGAKTTAAEQALAEIIAKPRLLLQKGKTFEEILNDLAAPDEPVDPRLAAIEAKLTEREQADKLAAEQRAKDETARNEADETAAKERGANNIAALVATEGTVADSSGYPRWAVISGDANIPAIARDKVSAYLAEKNLNPTHEQVVDMVRSCLDQMEQAARNELTAKHARLTAANRPQMPISEQAPSFSNQPTPPPPAIASRPSTVDTVVRSQPLPPPNRPAQHGFTGLLR